MGAVHMLAGERRGVNGLIATIPPNVRVRCAWTSSKRSYLRLACLVWMPFSAFAQLVPPSWGLVMTSRQYARSWQPMVTLATKASYTWMQLLTEVGGILTRTR